MKLISPLSQAVLLAAALAACGGSNSMSLVKGGTLEYDETVTVGAALEGYKYFDDYAWSELEDSQGRQVVEFRGHLDFDQFVDAELEGMKLSQDMVERGKSELSEAGMDLNYVIQFAIGKDGKTFQVKYSGLEMKGSNIDTGLSGCEDMPDEDLMIFQCIYSNQPEPATFGLLVSGGLG